MSAIQSTPRATAVSKKAVAAAEQFFADRGWTPFAFQRETWAAQAAGKSGLINAPTGFGKTYAAFCALCSLGPAGTDKLAPPSPSSGSPR